MAEPRIVYRDLQSAFRDRIQSYQLENSGHKNVDGFFDHAYITFEQKQQVLLSEHNFMKTYATFIVDLIKKASGDNDGEITQRFYIQCGTHVIDAVDTDLAVWYQEYIVKICKTQLDEFMAVESGWSLDSIIALDVHNNVYDPIRGSSYISLPARILKKKAVVNVENYDNMCFKWSILSAIHNISKDPQRVSKYVAYENQLDFSGISFPVKLYDIKRFEKNNPWISINVYTEQDNKIEVLRLANEIKPKHIHLLLLHEFVKSATDYDACDDVLESVVPIKSHYCWIKNLSRLLRSQCTKHKCRAVFCDCCLHYFHDEEKMEQHMVNCMKQTKCAIKMPSVTDNILQFKRFHNKLKVPFCIYADLESILIPPTDEDMPFCQSENTTSYQRHEAFSVGYYFKCAYDDSLSYYKSFYGPECVKLFCSDLYEVYEV